MYHKPLMRRINLRQILFYAGQEDKNKQRLETAVHDALPGWPIELFTHLDELRERFHNNIVEPNSIAVLGYIKINFAQQNKAIIHIPSAKPILPSFNILNSPTPVFHKAYF